MDLSTRVIYCQPTSFAASKGTAHANGVGFKVPKKAVGVLV